MKTTPDGKKRQRSIATGKQDDDRIRDKKKSKKRKKSKKQKTNTRNAIDDVIMDDIVVKKALSPPLIDSIFGRTTSNSTGSSDDGTKNTTIETAASSSLINSIFDNGVNMPTTTKSSSAMMSLFNNPKISTATRTNHHRQLVQRRQEKSSVAEVTAAMTETNDEDDSGKIRRTLRNRKYRSQHRPLMREALDFPGVFSNEEKDDGKGGFLLDDENERAKETADAIRDHGFCILRDVMHTDKNNGDTSGDCDDQHPLRDVVLPVAKDLQRRLNTALKARGIHHSTDTFRFREAASRCKGRTDVVFDAFERDEMMINVKQKVLRNSKLFPVIRNLLGGASNNNDDNDNDNGDVKLVYAGLIFSYPGSCDQPWHQDGVPLFPELPRDQSELLQASLPPYALNVFLPLEDEDGSIEKGPTELLPGSHKWTASDERLRLVIEKTNVEVDDEDTDTGDDSGTNGNVTIKDDKAIIAPVLKQGDALIYDYRVCHRGTANLFGRLESVKNSSTGTSTADTKSAKKKNKARDNENDVRGTRRILYLMYARPWFTDHVNFDYTKSAESLWNCH